jgi:glycogen operon protein
MTRHDVLQGQSFPLGATVYPDGVNFCIFSNNSTAVELLLFDHPDAPAPARVIHLDPIQNRTYYYWHVFVKGLQAGQLYGYRMYGAFDPERGLWFDGSKVLIDPYALAVMYGGNYSREAAIRPGDNCAHAMKSVVVDPDDYDWEGDMPIHRPFVNSIIYEMHVGGFTRHPSSGIEPQKRGTYAALIDKIPYLQELGILSVELMPVQQFDEYDAPLSLTNYWGYSPVAFFAPHRGYSHRKDPLGPVDEFRDMVKAMHRAGIEVILDVVFNHTSEGNHKGPTLSFRGIENRAYYILEKRNNYLYANYTGCGNTLNANHSIVRRLIMDCLRYWVQSMHVDGFRFDLASILSRGEDGQPLKNPPVLWDIESDPILAGTKIIAEAWDAAGLYQVGSFTGDRWAEWNGRYRDEVRRFVRGDSGTVSNLAAYISGSTNIYPEPGRDPSRSINFVTAHDGFTLNDLVSYNEKHNFDNGEHNLDGTNDNLSWNCGVEGTTSDETIEALRARQIKNFLTILLVSQGKPMLLMGDEVRRTQKGNNNAYCQDNELSWFNWNDLEQHGYILRFMRNFIRFRHEYGVFHDKQFWTEPGGPEIIWHGVHLHQPDWGEHSHSLAFELYNPSEGEHMYVMLNAYWDSLTFELPSLPSDMHWCRTVDTNLVSPHDFADNPEPIQYQHHYTASPRSSVVLVALKNY